VSSGTDLQTASYDIVVDQLAQGTITASNGFTSKTQVLNSASAFSIDFTIGTTSPTVSSVSVTTDTPAGIVSAVNAADIGITARLVNRSATGNDWVVLFEGTTGIENAFTATSTPDIGLGKPLTAAIKIRLVISIRSQHSYYVTQVATDHRSESVFIKCQITRKLNT